MLPATRQRLVELVDAGHSDAECAAVLGVTPRTVLRWRTQLQLPSRWQPQLPEHGTVARYGHRTDPCRCADCRAANAAAVRAYRDRLNAALPAPKAYAKWTPGEDAVLLDDSLGTVWQRARMVGRSFGAATQRLDELRNGPRT
jgi:hypothetical protein